MKKLYSDSDELDLGSEEGLQKAIEKEKKELRKAVSKKIKLEKQLQKRIRKRKIPLQVLEDVKQAGKILKDNENPEPSVSPEIELKAHKTPKEIKKRLVKVYFFAFMVFIFIFVISSESFLDFVKTPSIQGRYLFETCQIEGLGTCDFQIYDDFSKLSMRTNSFVFQDIKIDVCKTYEVQENNIILLYNCTFSNTNRINFEITYTLPDKTLLRYTDGLVIKSFEITRLSYITNKSANKITGFFVSDSENSNTYK